MSEKNEAWTIGDICTHQLQCVLHSRSELLHFKMKCQLYLFPLVRIYLETVLFDKKNPGVAYTVQGNSV